MTTIQRALFKRKRGDTADAWADRVLRRGGTFNATTLAALRALDYDMAYFGIKSKMIYFNPRCGDNITAALTPMIARDGPGFDVLQSGTLAAWNESAGLLNSASGVVNLGVVVPRVAAINQYSFAMGAYLLNDVASSGSGFMIPLNGTRPEVVANFAGFQILDHNPIRVQTNASLTADGASTKGLICGSVWGSGTNDNGVFRNMVLRGTGINTLASTPPFSAMTLVPSLATSGGDFISTGLSPEEVSNLFWMIHRFNASLTTPRQVTAEGVS